MSDEPISLDPDPAIEACKRNVDRSLQDFVRFTAELREARRRARE